MRRDDDATPEQYTELRRLFAERHQDSIAAVEALKSDVNAGAPVGKREASLAIALLRVAPVRIPAREGIYRVFPNTYYRVQTSKAGKLYARRLLSLQTKKVDGRDNWSYEPWMVHELASEQRLSTAEIDRISHEYMVCLMCGSYRGSHNRIFGPNCLPALLQLGAANKQELGD